MSFESFAHVALPESVIEHIWNGESEDSRRGGHRFGLGREGKTEFPEDWSLEMVYSAVRLTLDHPQAGLRYHSICASWRNSMTGMDEAEFVAHALCNYLRPMVQKADMRSIDEPLECGEPIVSLCCAVGVAAMSRIPLAPEMISHVLELPGLSDDDRLFFTDEFAKLPAWTVAA
jgi:hypothetical protein